MPIRSTVADSYPLNTWTTSPWVDGFLEELHTVQPVLIVAMGRAVFDALRKLDKLYIPLEQVTHHGYLARMTTKQAALERLALEMGRVSRVYDRLKGH